MADREHNIESRTCWCDPELLQPCPDCPDQPQPDCWKCSGRGTVPVFDEEEPVIIVHRYPEAGNG